MRPRSRSPRSLSLATVLAAAVLCGCGGGSDASSQSGGVAAQQPAGAASASDFDGALLPAGAAAPNFVLRDLDGRQVSLAQYHGQVVVLAFLYSTCGASCIVIAQQIRGALNELPHPPAVLIVSADPSADTPARIAAFLRQVSLSGRVHYLTGPPAQLEKVWQAYRVKPASTGAATFAKYASVLLIDREGRPRVLFGSEQLTPESLSHDIGRLQNG